MEEVAAGLKRGTKNEEKERERRKEKEKG